MKLYLTLLLILTSTLTFATAKENFVHNKRRLQEQIVARVCKTEPQHPVCADQSHFFPLAPRLTPNQVLHVFIGDTDISTNFFELAPITTGKVVYQPWSGHYWPIYQGGIAARSADPNFPTTDDYREIKKYMLEDLSKIDLNTIAPHVLSPAEKYDLINHDTQFSLTRSSLEEGEMYLSHEADKVETWMGICHGWAPAAFVLPRPAKSVTVSTPLLTNNSIKDITFTPDDIKALGSQLWAKSEFPTAFIGSRCNEKEPHHNNSGRIIDNTCFDTDPASFHIALIERLGKRQKSFVLDVTYNYEVWNQPIVSYELSYTNPINKKSYPEIEKNIVKIKDLRKDSYKKFRHPRATQIVQVQVEFVYVGETRPSQTEIDIPDYDNLITATYDYDLELDAQGEILGGEWHQKEHPDFMWTPISEIAAQSPFDRFLEVNWNPSEPVPAIYTSFSQGAGKMGFPLFHIIGPLFESAK